MLNLSRLTRDQLYSERDAAWHNLQSLRPGDSGYTRAEGELTTIKMEIDRRIVRRMVEVAHAA